MKIFIQKDTKICIEKSGRNRLDMSNFDPKMLDESIIADVCDETETCYLFYNNSKICKVSKKKVIRWG
jgi:hypothetical protein